MTGVDLPRLLGRRMLAQEALGDAEYRQALALQTAEYLTRPRVRLTDRRARVVRIQNAPTEAIQSPPATLTYPWWDQMLNRYHLEPVAKFAGAPTPRDLDYRVIEGTRAAREFWAVLADDEPSVTVQRSPSGRAVRMVIDLGS